MDPVIRISDEVRDAVAARRPVVALESTIFTHGLPRPRNLEVALEAEARLREADVVPATVGVLRGVPTVGLSTDEITDLATAETVTKLSVRELPIAVARRLSGGTTVAATALLAHRGGVEVFATGGLGGVHRGAQSTFDESADLVVLSTVPILVVSAGVKSILDIPATLERLETLSIPVVGYRTTSFPGFYIRESGCRLEHSVGSPAEVAALVRARDALGLKAGVLLANPVPEDAQLDPALHARVLHEAEERAAAAGVVGKDTTPFLLDHFHRATGGRSLDVNVEVYRGNVALGGAVATALAAEPR
ncbi:MULTISPECIES: pseudouridine-5'-phosphate glycosidase [unclassified Rhodococcus (in: high G+C Gram-positive bacteria)]|uniref:pseudouridine-5'-phosphate glycosidase n=1 Tax=unclassified Rhodococcus (in: high G+C Gram-positive bacteria) TaxID=192944 RepID=UPI000929DA3A|nr:pseudouridine-5'-phosphate glycosidase [Rhodococcus sp. M8]OLL18296.1 pseudouridine-5-phosphate glycosidase [Rhodococcus sp. M8]QPG45353.1 pseudouridine-5'-phosphate glycosidase [Rhodococcus sp. M8]